MEISIIIPTYKPNDYLWKCLDSIVNQTISKQTYEIVLVLNGCEEPWLSEIKSFISNRMSDCQVLFIHLQQGGVSNARNVGIDNARGTYITFLDDDDFVSETYLEELLKVSTSKIVGVARPVAFTEGVNTSQQYIVTDVFDKMYPATNISFLKMRRYLSGPCMKLFHRDLIGNHRFNTSFTVGEDGLFMFSISDNVKRCSLANSSAIYFRRYREGSLTTVRTGAFIRHNNIRMLGALTSIYLSSPKQYSLILYLLQSLSCIKGIIMTLFKRHKAN